MLTPDHIDFINDNFTIEPFENMSDNDFSTDDEDDNPEDKKGKMREFLPNILNLTK